MRSFCFGLAAMCSLSGAQRAPVAAPRVVVDVSEDNGVLIDLAPSCAALYPCPERRSVFVNTAALGLPGQPGGVWLSYDYDALTRPLSTEELAAEDELSLAVRLVISEVGADRLLYNRYGVLEAIGILFTVDNRLSGEVSNPLGMPTAPRFEGCGPDGTFASCANAGQYLGMATWRALSPRARYRPALLEAAVDRAVAAWWLQENGLVDDFTHGATNYVHRCGGAAYGMTTHHCDGHLGKPRRDVKGANPFTGPIVFRAPEAWLSRKGFYSLYESVHVDYAPWWEPGAADALLAALDAGGPSPALPAPAPPPPDHDQRLDGIADAFGPPEDDEVRGILLRSHLR